FSGFCDFAFLISTGDGCIALSELFSVQARHVWVLFCGFICDVYTICCTSCPKVYHSRPSFFFSASELSKFGFDSPGSCCSPTLKRGIHAKPKRYVVALQ
ncbi:unnamed protein product, partial [Ectocarpus sp. 12 AP-2014]